MTKKKKYSYMVRVIVQVEAETELLADRFLRADLIDMKERKQIKGVSDYVLLKTEEAKEN